MDEAERSGVDQLIGWPVGRNICLDAVQRCCDGVAGDTLARGHVGKGDYKREAKLTRGSEAQDIRAYRVWSIEYWLAMGAGAGGLR